MIPFFKQSSHQYWKNSREKICAGWLDSSPTKPVSHNTLQCAATERVSLISDLKPVLLNCQVQDDQHINVLTRDCTSYILPDPSHWALLCYNDTIKILEMHKSPRDRAFTLRWGHPKAALLPGKSTQRREHPNLTCRPPAQKTQILGSDRQPEEQVCHLRVHPGMKQVKGCADGHPSILDNAKEGSEIKRDHYQAFLKQIHMPPS